MSYHLDPDNDRNEAYAVIPMPAELGGPTDWWTVTAHGVPVWHFPPDKRDLAGRFATDPAYRQQCTNKKKRICNARVLSDNVTDERRAIKANKAASDDGW